MKSPQEWMDNEGIDLPTTGPTLVDAILRGVEAYEVDRAEGAQYVLKESIYDRSEVADIFMLRTDEF